MKHRVVLLALLMMATAAGRTEQVTLGGVTGGGNASGQGGGVAVRGAIGALAPPSGQAGPAHGGIYAVATGFLAALGPTVARSGADAHWLEISRWPRSPEGAAMSFHGRWKLEVACLIPCQDEWMPRP